MIEREEVVRILDSIKGNKPTARASITSERLAALCRAWLAVEDAPVGVVDIRTGWDDGSGAIEVHYEEGRPDIPLKQRVRIVKEGE